MKLNMKSKSVKSCQHELMTNIRFLRDEAQEARDENRTRYVESWEYWRGNLPLHRKYKTKTWVYPFIRKATDKIMPSLLNVFTENEDAAVEFYDKKNKLPAPVIESVNSEINRLFLEENDGYNVLSTAFLEGLVCGDTFLKVYIEDKWTEEDFTIEDWAPIEMFQALAIEFPETDPSTLEFKTVKQSIGIDPQLLEDADLPEELAYEEVQLVKGSVTLRRVDRFPKIEHVPLAEILFSGASSVDISTAKYVCHTRNMTVSDAIQMGFDANVIKEAPTASVDSDDFETTEEIVVNKMMNSKTETNTWQGDPLQRTIKIDEHYVYSSLFNKKDELKLYQVYSTANDILSIEEVDFIPFIHGVPEVVPMSPWGMSMYDRYKDYQDMITFLQHLFFENTDLAVNPRYMAVKGNYDRSSLLQNRPGAIIEVTQPGSVDYFHNPQMSPIAGEIYSQIYQSGQDDVMTSVGMTMGENSMSNMAATTVAMLTHMAELKDRVIAKSFAQTLVRPLFAMIYKVLRAEDFEIKLNEPLVEGEMVMESVFGSDLPSRSDFRIDVNTNNDTAVKMSQIMNTVQMLSGLTAAQHPIVSNESVYNIATDLLKTAGVVDVDRYITNPATLPQPTPEEMAQVKAEEEELKAVQRETAKIQIELAKADLKLKIASAAGIEADKAELIKSGAAKREREKEESVLNFRKHDLATAKLQLEKEAMALDATLTQEMGKAVNIRR